MYSAAKSLMLASPPGMPYAQYTPLELQNLQVNRLSRLKLTLVRIYHRQIIHTGQRVRMLLTQYAPADFQSFGQKRLGERKPALIHIEQTKVIGTDRVS